MTGALATVHDTRDLVGDFVRPAQDVRFPVAEDDPTRFLERPGLPAIAFHVPCDLGYPVLGVVATGEPGKSALKVTAVPEVAIAEDSDALLAEHDVRATCQPWMVKAIAETALPQFTPQHQLAAGVGFLARAPCSGGSLLGRGEQPSERG